MELTLIAVAGVISIVAVAAFSEKLGLAAPLSLVIVGIALSYVPGVPRIRVDPEVVLTGVLPPLLYAAAVNMPATDFRRNLKSISGLAVLLVAATTLGTGWLFHALLPGIGWPAAFALGAVVSPTDAVAASSIGHKLGLPSRLLAVLEGEGLVNDASALVLLRSAVAAIASSVSMGGLAWDFVKAVVIAAVIGLVVGYVNVRIRGLLHDGVLNTAISFVVPFLAFVPAEELRASGVLAVVVAGLVSGEMSPRYVRAADRMTERMNWRTLAFLLESGIFLLMGLGLRSLIDDVGGEHLSAWTGLWVGLAASAAVILLRIGFVAPLVAVLRRDRRRAEEAKPRLERMKTRIDEHDLTERFSPRQAERITHRVVRVAADIEFQLNEDLGWRGGVVLAWSGMRGAITVAAAETLPADLTRRPQMILIATVVALTTLLVNGLTLPAVIRAVRIPGDDEGRIRAEYADLMATLTAAGREYLADPGPDVDPQVVAEVRERLEQPLRNVEQEARRDLRDEYLRVTLGVLEAEQARLLRARSEGVYSSRTLTQIQRRLDIQTATMQRIGDEEG
ncbi:NhaP-type Na+/H+ or K+/H+ antiporter [Catenulispora sp. MAP12-49]|uniref:cation:proton antiporter n=1 Tax=unclassified Catenulispora TaxID=414885 RepID=UPI00351626F5